MWKSPPYRGEREPYVRPEDASRPKKNGYCTQCGGILMNIYRFCPGCGLAVEARAVPENHCACGSVFAPADKFCTSCGKPRAS